MNMTEQIRIILVKRGNMSEAELARRIGTSPQNMHNKFVRNNFTIKDLEQIATALDCSLQINFRDNETNNIL
jgi:DNA-binding Xre family transcriptional regulator